MSCDKSKFAALRLSNKLAWSYNTDVKVEKKLKTDCCRRNSKNIHDGAKLLLALIVKPTTLTTKFTLIILALGTVVSFRWYPTSSIFLPTLNCPARM